MYEVTGFQTEPYNAKSAFKLRKRTMRDACLCAREFLADTPRGKVFIHAIEKWRWPRGGGSRWKVGEYTSADALPQ